MAPDASVATTRKTRTRRRKRLSAADVVVDISSPILKDDERDPHGKSKFVLSGIAPSRVTAFATYSQAMRKAEAQVILSQCADINKMTGNCSCSGHCRRHQVGAALEPLATFKVAV